MARQVPCRAHHICCRGLLQRGTIVRPPCRTHSLPALRVSVRLVLSQEAAPCRTPCRLGHRARVLPEDGLARGASNRNAEDVHEHLDAGPRVGGVDAEPREPKRQARAQQHARHHDHEEAE
eukprot:363939-Chlamydomonas_euryale.AAC.8